MHRSGSEAEGRGKELIQEEFQVLVYLALQLHKRMPLMEKHSAKRLIYIMCII